MAVVASGMGRAAYFVGEKTSYPELAMAVPNAAPLDVEELTVEQRQAWLSLLASCLRPAAASDGEDPLGAFMVLNPPPRFAAIGTMRWASRQAEDGRLMEAESLLREAFERAGDAPGESGYPLRLFAELQMLPLLPESQRAAAANALCGEAVVRAARLAPALIARAAEFAPSAREWLRVIEAHGRARELRRAVDANEPGAHVSVEGEDCLPLAAEVRGGRWIVAAALGDLRESAEALIAAKPAQFGMTIHLGTMPLIGILSAHDSLATVETPIALAGGSALPLRVDVFLENPDLFFAQQHARTVRFGALIAAAAGTVLVGFFAAWRAFRRQQQLSEMKTNFVSSVSHELRAPIASVRLMAEELDGGAMAGQDKVQQYHRFIVGECRRLSAVIENVLDFSRREQGREEFEFESTDLVRLVEESVALMQIYAAEKRLSLRTEIESSLEPIEADGRALQRLLVNLVDNAIKHSREGDAVTVGLASTTTGASLWVEDHGPGIPRGEHERIFERFYRLGTELRRETQGVGLGLSIVKHVATVHGGRVLLRSEVGKGSRFTVELPRERIASAGAGSNGRSR